MANITIKDIPPELHQRLKERAARNRRSLNSEVIRCLEDAVGPRKVSVEQELENINVLRESLKGYKLSNEFLKRAKDQGRP